MTWVTELCKTLTSVDPEFGGAVIPAADADIKQLATLIRREIPGDYREFLSIMGGYDGGLFYEERCNTRLRRVLSYCRRQEAAARDIGAALCVPIAIGFDFEGYCLAMEGDPPHPPVAILDDLRAGAQIFPNLPAMSFSLAFYFEMCGTGKYISVTEFAGQNGNTLAEMFVREGYHREWFSSERRIYLRSGRQLVMIIVDLPTLAFGGHDDIAFDHVFRQVTRLFGKVGFSEKRQLTLPEIRQHQQRHGQP
jgi:hypothetical protein